MTNKLDTLNISTTLLCREAERRGYELEFFSAGKTVDGVLTVVRSKGQKAFSYKSTSSVLNPSYALLIAQDKRLTGELLISNRLPVAPTLYMQRGDDNKAIEFLKTHVKVVVKPVAMNHGDGVTVNIKDERTLLRAIANAMKISNSDDVLIQRQIDGLEYRVLVLNGAAVAAYVKEPAFVIGDGSSTIKELVVLENASSNRSSSYATAMSTIDLRRVIDENGEEFMQYVPSTNEKKYLLGSSSISLGGVATSCLDTMSETVIRTAIDVANACDMGLAGVDIIVGDNGDMTILEVNATPSIRTHHAPPVGPSVNVASMILDAIESRSKSPTTSTIGVSSYVDFIGYKNLKQIPARIDTGARTSSLWASDIKVKENIVTFKLFGPNSSWYTGKVVRRKIIELREVTSSTGHTQTRYLISMPIVLHGKRLSARFTLADRSTQMYPILIGRNTLRRNFLVDSADPGEARLYKFPEEANEFNESETI